MRLTPLIPLLFLGAAPALAQSEIANRPGINPQSLHRFIESTHWEKNIIPASALPPPPVTRDQEAKIIAYLLSLKKPATP